MEPLKEMFNLEFYKHFANAFGNASKAFRIKEFIKEAMAGIEHRSLNQRLRHTSTLLRNYLPANYKKAIQIMYKAAPDLRKGYTALVLPDFVGLYGKEDFDTSMEALKYFTTLGSSEAAIREFLKTDLKKTLKVMEEWAQDKDVHVRRLASEGSRPRLPWSFKLSAIIQDPTLTRRILETLNADPELYVRKSVANHLNDISRDHPEYMLRLVKSWNLNNPHTAWIVKHASRTLIKKGHEGSLSIFKFEKDPKLKFDRFTLSPRSISLGETLTFSFRITSEKRTPQKLAIDYAVHYLKASGAKSRKVFKLKEMTLEPHQQVEISKKQLFKDFTTRIHYPGRHAIEILINGRKMGEKSFAIG